VPNSHFLKSRCSLLFHETPLLPFPLTWEGHRCYGLPFLKLVFLSLAGSVSAKFCHETTLVLVFPTRFCLPHLPCPGHILAFPTGDLQPVCPPPTRISQHLMPPSQTSRATYSSVAFFTRVSGYGAPPTPCFPSIFLFHCGAEEPVFIPPHLVQEPPRVTNAWSVPLIFHLLHNFRRACCVPFPMSLPSLQCNSPLIFFVSFKAFNSNSPLA